jgi:hypothetical protein
MPFLARKYSDFQRAEAASTLFVSPTDKNLSPRNLIQVPTASSIPIIPPSYNENDFCTVNQYNLKQSSR